MERRQKDCESQRLGYLGETMWSGHDRTPVLNSQQLLLPTNDLHETKTTNIAAWMGRGTEAPTP